MTEYKDIFIQAYWWLSLLGGVHCFGVALYIRVLHQSPNANHKSLAGVFALIGFYFLTGIFTKESSPIPVHLMLTLFYPIYFLLMPLLYIYSKQSLYTERYQANYLKHFIPALLIAMITSSAILFRIGIKPNTSDDAITTLADLSHINIFALVLPCFILLQTIIYFVLIYKLLINTHKQNKLTNPPAVLDINFRWICILCSALLLNWILRLALIYLPFYFGDSTFLLQQQAITRLSLLVTIYALAFYGLHQVTRTAYLKGLATQANINTQKSTKTPILDADEMSYLQDVIANESPDKHKD
ncbi:hypothetical protein [Shewanella holmiensis]|uniref:Uncharacterized protein n=1 Tax=Shewanella holmiensis TaxID=2952222 RepID=A0A9X3AM23_9GAMM|nr:hypothetical protein [Shewanella holmiensis]MCT7941207.1 hypothetical protein [Shewanella holmiensis]